VSIRLSETGSRFIDLQFPNLSSLSVSCLKMASDETSNVSDVEKVAENKDYNPKLDFFSEQFDPLLALRTPNIVVPVINAKTYDNIYKYKSMVEGKPEQKKKPVRPPEEAPIERRWLPHQCKC
jgi:hypothetical protein